MADPLELLSHNIHQVVRVTTIDNIIVEGELLSVDDYCNLMLVHWTCSSAASSTAAARGDSVQEMESKGNKKKARVDKGGEVDGHHSCRFIRGAQVKEVALATIEKTTPTMMMQHEHQQRPMAFPSRGSSSSMPGAAAGEVPVGSKRYIRSAKLGEGSYGKVYLCRDVVENRDVAVKVTSQDTNEGVPATAIREVSLLMESRHPCVVRLLDTFSESGNLCLVFELLDKDLKKMLEQRVTPVVGRKLKDMMYQLLSGLHACHSRRVVHRDIKPGNILISEDERRVKLADFGLGRAFGLSMQTYTYRITTLYYRAPEIVLGETRYLPSVDMWSMGCVMAEMCMNRPLFRGECEIDHLFKIFDVLGTPTEQVWPGVTSLPYYNKELPQKRPKPLSAVVPMLDEEGLRLLGSMLRYDPRERITAVQALQHPFFDDVRQDCEAAIAEAMRYDN